jgi:NtrC-family two-component system sensor histidine kinase KinB
MSLKLKIRLSILFLLVLLLALGAQALYATERLHRATQADLAAEHQLTAILLVLSTAVGLTMLVRLPRQVTRPLRRLVADVEDVAGPGPATRVPIGRNDEVGSVAAAVNRVLRQAQDEQRATLAQLITERNRMASVVDSLNEGLLLLDQHEVIILANPVAGSILGLRPAELLGQAAANLAEHNEPLRQMLAALHPPATPGSEPAPMPLFTIRPHGENQHYRLSTAPVEVLHEETRRREPAGHLLCLTNVSDFKRLDELKSNFLATISHELKTPLSSINLSLMLLRDERTDAAERQRLADGIGHETRRLLGLVGQLLDVSRLDAGSGIKLNQQPFQLAEVLRYATDTVRPQLADKQLQLAVELPEGLPAVLADVEKTTWVLINLLSNAVRYSPVGARLHIRVQRWGEMLRLSVQDAGPGIAPEYHRRIFQRFAAVPGATQHSTGLGLSISAEFIAAQGGQLWVESQPGAGSCFLFTLPVSQ